ncbi:hypothetical protein OLMES_3340 [Oleiphilus messinensis]|uniref:Tetratricopeptide repeat protein n=1 Tax=Oleiphilus messinensis TaxID=141451 RepID=A0A1Y0IAV3_9GAMM|nr:tetratricopeptide repeat protein [Oleiphilus messinensis]ARU57380.1 hypothetical protein OLMES_3340 [Oleiphilus messinensis]
MTRARKGINSVKGLFALLFLPFLVAPITAHGEDLPPELARGVMLYDYHQQNYFKALIEAPVSPQDPGLLEIDERLAFLIAESLAEFGVTNRAQSQLELLAKNKGGRIAAEAFFRLGRIQYKHGDFPGALASLKRVNGLDRKLLPHYQYYYAAANMRTEQVAKAADILQQMQEGAWAGYAYYNLAKSYQQKDSNNARSIISLRVADALSQQVKKDYLSVDEPGALADRIYMASAVLALQGGEFDKTLGFLNRIRVDSPITPTALYLHGLTYLQRNQFRQAIQSWHRAKRYPMVVPGVADAFLGIAYAYQHEGYRGRASRSYLESISVLDKEVRTLDTVINTVRKLGADAALIQESELDTLEWFLEDGIADNTPKVAYMNALINDGEVFSLVESLEELIMLEQNLSEWQSDLTVFEGMLQQRRNGFRQGNALISAVKAKNLVEKMQNRAESLEKELRQAQQNKEFIYLAKPEVQEQYAHAQRLKQNYRNYVKKGKVTGSMQEDLNLRLERVNGLLLWKASQDYLRNVADIEDDLAALQREINRYEGSISAFEKIVSDGPVRFDSLLDNVLRESVRVKDALQRCSTLRAEVDQVLTDEVIKRLEAKRTEMTRYHDIAQQALAHLYETLLIERDELEKKRAEAARKKEEEQLRLEQLNSGRESEAAQEETK